MFPDVTYENEEAQNFVEAIDYQQGQVSFPAIGLDLNIPANFYFLSADHAKRVLTELWGNPPATAEGILGMVMPTDKTPVEDTWAALVSHESNGYVSDEDAQKSIMTNCAKR